MHDVIRRFEKLLETILNFIKNTDKTALEFRPENKWSKKEILGHLVDSSIHNLVRFTEIHYAAKPYVHRSYNQNDLVRINKYQEADIDELLQLWLSVNKQILRLFQSVDEEALQYKIELNDKAIVNLRFLMTDYVDHLEHHSNQLMKK